VSEGKEEKNEHLIDKIQKTKKRGGFLALRGETCREKL